MATPLTAVKSAPDHSGMAGRNRLNVNAWPTERWAGVLVLGSLALLIAIRAGFRGVNVLGVRASVG